MTSMIRPKGYHLQSDLESHSSCTFLIYDGFSNRRQIYHMAFCSTDMKRNQSFVPHGLYFNSPYVSTANLWSACQPRNDLYTAHIPTPGICTSSVAHSCCWAMWDVHSTYCKSSRCISYRAQTSFCVWIPLGQRCVCFLWYLPAPWTKNHSDKKQNNNTLKT